jgi:hypothetical protein
MGYKNKDNISPLALQEVRNYLGFTQSQEELKEKEGVKDTWLVAGKQVTEEDNITVERNWLYGINSNQHALVLQFIIRGQGAVHMLSPGMYLDAELVFFPSANPLRALIKGQAAAVPLLPQKLLNSWSQIAEEETIAFSRFPVLGERPFGIKKVVPVFFNNTWWLKDSENSIVQVEENFEPIWKLLSISGGEPLDTIVIGKEKVFNPVGVWHQNTYKAF